jgi:hypothetical protein
MACTKKGVRGYVGAVHDTNVSVDVEGRPGVSWRLRCGTILVSGEAQVQQPLPSQPQLLRPLLLLGTVGTNAVKRNTNAVNATRNQRAGSKPSNTLCVEWGYGVIAWEAASCDLRDQLHTLVPLAAALVCFSASLRAVD